MSDLAPFIITGVLAVAAFVVLVYLATTFSPVPPKYTTRTHVTRRPRIYDWEKDQPEG